MTTRARLALYVAAATVAAQAAVAEVSERIMRVAGTTVSYKLVLPNGYDAAKTYPAILVFGGGPQTMNTIEGALARNFQAEAEQRGYIVVGPAAPDGDLFFYDGDRIFPEFLDNLRDQADQEEDEDTPSTTTVPTTTTKPDRPRGGGGTSTGGAASNGND